MADVQLTFDFQTEQGLQKCECEQCEVYFEPKGKRRYCSERCSRKRFRESKKCKNCDSLMPMLLGAGRPSEFCTDCRKASPQLPRQNCKQCGKTLNAQRKPGGRPQQFCDRICCQAFFHCYENRPKIQKTCDGCGKLFMAEKRNRKGNACSFRCAGIISRKGRPPARVVICEWCTTEYRPGRKGTRFCSRPCADAWHGERKRLRLLRIIDDRPFMCQWCGIPYIDTEERAGGCNSTECRAQYRSSQKALKRICVKPTIIKECAACLCTFLATKKRVTCSNACKIKHAKNQDYESMIRRIFRMNGCDAEPYSRMQIFKRDNWTCKLCGELVDRNVRYPHQKSASIDHVIPLAKGGADADWNVQCAHLDCNTLKGDKIGVLL